MNTFGSCSWTGQKLKILEDYAIEYLKIMKSRTFWTTLYFDGFAGTGKIKTNDLSDEELLGSALRILAINEPASFDYYYFVEKNSRKLADLKNLLDTEYPNKKDRISYEAKDCNQRLLELADFLKTGQSKKYRILAYIDPCGMQLNWKSLEAIKGYGIDMWILVPTGIGINRLLKSDCVIDENWLIKLENFLGLTRTEILEHFYHEEENLTLFGNITESIKIDNAISNSAKLYKKKLNEIFDFVTEPYILKNSKNSVMYHFFMASNNKTAYKIATHIINKYNQLNNGTLKD